MEPIYLKTTELAERLRTTARTIRRWVKDGKLTPAVKQGRVIRFDLDAARRELAR